MTPYVLDASAMIAYLNGEPGGSMVATLLTDPDAVCYAHAINLCEVYYAAYRRAGQMAARQVLEALDADGVIERRDTSRRFWRRVGELKAGGGISLPDCFCVILGQHLNAQAVTADHKEFDPLVPRNICPILFIR